MSHQQQRGMSVASLTNKTGLSTRSFSAIHLWRQSGRGHCGKFSSNCPQTSANFRGISALFPDAINSIFANVRNTSAGLSTKTPFANDPISALLICADLLKVSGLWCLLSNSTVCSKPTGNTANLKDCTTLENPHWITMGPSMGSSQGSFEHCSPKVPLGPLGLRWPGNSEHKSGRFARINSLKLGHVYRGTARGAPGGREK